MTLTASSCAQAVLACVRTGTQRGLRDRTTESGRHDAVSPTARVQSEGHSCGARTPFTVLAALKLFSNALAFAARRQSLYSCATVLSWAACVPDMLQESAWRAGRTQTREHAHAV